MSDQDELVAELAHELDQLMLEFVGRGLPGVHVLSAAHGHVVGRLAAICGKEATAAHLRATAASVGRLTELRLDRQEPDRTWHRLDADGHVTQERKLPAIMADVLAARPQMTIKRMEVLAPGLELNPGA